MPKIYDNGFVREMTEEEAAGLDALPLTPAQQRELAYNTKSCIDWDGDVLTVTEAAQKWAYYASEGSARANELTVLIAAAKAQIRAVHPDGG